jgi:hypothetical protein
MSFNKETIKYINFHNDSELPIIIDSWVDGTNRLQSIDIEPGQKLIIHSSVGEWHLHAMLDTEKRKIWNDKGLKRVVNIGKFRSQPCASGDYSWLDYDNIFDCVYSEIPENLNSENKIRGLITFSEMVKP